MPYDDRAVNLVQVKEKEPQLVYFFYFCLNNSACLFFSGMHKTDPRLSEIGYDNTLPNSYEGHTALFFWVQTSQSPMHSNLTTTNTS